MLKMVLKFDEEKVKANGYDLREIYNDVNGLMSDGNLTVEEDGIYTDRGVDEYEAVISFMAITPIISERKWIKFASEWLWYESEGDDIDDEDDDFPNNLLKTYEIMTE